MITEETLLYPDTLPTPLIDRNHAFKSRPDVTIMETGRARRRRTALEPIEYLECTWNFTQDEFESFKEFYEGDLSNGAFEFAMTTFDRSPVPGEMYEVTRLLAFAGPYSFIHSDNLYTVNGVLEVVWANQISVEDPDYIDPTPGDDLIVPLMSYAPCKEEFTMTIPDMEPQTVYAVEISSVEADDWDVYFYYGLHNESEIDSLSKDLVINNAFNGEWKFRIRQMTGEMGGQVISEEVTPEPSIVPVPVVSIGNLSLIMTPSDVDTDTYPERAHLQPLSVYQKQGWTRPLTYIEDPLGWAHQTTYYSVQKKYAGRWINNNQFGNMDGSILGFNQPVSVTGAEGAVHKWTRDGSDPTEDTVIRSMDGYENNAAVHLHAFVGLIKCRSFKDGCRSPLAVIAIDKVFYETPQLAATYSGSSVANSCDHEREGPDGPVQSGVACSLWGDDAGVGFEDYLDGLAITAPGGGAAQGQDPLLTYINEVDASDRVDYLGWVNHRVFITYARIESLSWVRQSRWLEIPNHLHAWSRIGNTNGFAPNHIIPEDFAADGVLVPFHPGGGSGANSQFDFVLFETISGGHRFNQTFESIALFGQYGNLLGGAWFDKEQASAAYIYEFDIILSVFNFPDQHQYYWDEISDNLGGMEDIIDPEPEPDPETTTEQEQDGDNFETYADGDAEVGTLDGGDGWAGPWVIATYYGIAGGDDFESYTVGEITDGDGSLEGGDSWAGPWIIGTPETNILYGDDFESYDDGEANRIGSDGGTGWAGPWVFDRTGDGGDDFETYTDGDAEDQTLDDGTVWLGEWTVTSHNNPVDSPADITGLALWFDADDASTLFQDSALTTPASSDNDPVGGWKDKSGNLYHGLQATSGKRPLLKLNRLGGKPTILFDGTDDFLNLTTALTLVKNVSGLTVISIVKKTSGSGGQFVFAATTNSGSTRVGIIFNQTTTDQITSGGRRLDADSFAGKESAGILAATFYNFLSFYDYSAATLGMEILGEDNPAPSSWQTAGSTSNTDSTRVILGAFDDGNQHFNGELPEFLVYTKILSSLEIEGIVGYLREKYSIY